MKFPWNNNIFRALITVLAENSHLLNMTKGNDNTICFSRDELNPVPVGTMNNLTF